MNETIQAGRERAFCATVHAVPWDPDSGVRLRFDANAATAVDFFSLAGLSFAQCLRLEARREALGGFASAEAFEACLREVKDPADERRNVQ